MENVPGRDMNGRFLVDKYLSFSYPINYVFEILNLELYKANAIHHMI